MPNGLNRIARLLRCLMTRVRRANGTELACLFRLHACLDSPHSTLPKDRPATARDLEEELVSLMSDIERPDSLASALAEVHRVGGNVRERLSSDMSRLVVALAESTSDRELHAVCRVLGGARRMPGAALRIFRHGA